jgi:hypothetical protein
MTVKTYVEFEELVEKRFKEYEELEAGRMRMGQVYFNTLDEVRPGIAKKLRGSMIDPFHKTRITPPVRNFVLENWN